MFELFYENENMVAKSVEELMMESNLRKLTTMSEINTLKYIQKVDNISTSVIIESVSDFKANRLFSEAYDAFYEAEKSLWEKIKEYIVRLFDALLGKKPKEEQLQQLRESNAPVKIGFLEKLMAPIREANTAIKALIAGGTIAGAGVTVKYGLPAIKKLFEKKQEVDKNPDATVDGEKAADTMDDAFKMAEDMKKAAEQANENEKLKEEVEAKDEEGKTVKVSKLTVLKTSATQFSNFVMGNVNKGLAVINGVIKLTAKKVDGKVKVARDRVGEEVNKAKNKVQNTFKKKEKTTKDRTPEKEQKKNDLKTESFKYMLGEDIADYILFEESLDN